MLGQAIASSAARAKCAVATMKDWPLSLKLATSSEFLSMIFQPETSSRPYSTRLRVTKSLYGLATDPHAS
jgi:hypothetical protein